MAFSAGAVSFGRFYISGQVPKEVDEKLLASLREHLLKESEIGAAPEEEYGFCGGRHVWDATIGFETNVYAEAVCLAMRVDTNRVPAEVKKAYQLTAEESAGRDSAIRRQRAREQMKQQIDNDIRSGKYRRSKLVPILWDVPHGVIYSPATGSNGEKLIELFERALGIELEAATSGVLAQRLLEKRSRRRDLEDSRPTRFVSASGQSNAMFDYPWLPRGEAGKNFLGNEFLLWLWHEADHHAGVIEWEGDSATVLIDRVLDMDCALGESGRVQLKGDGPARMPEAKAALRTGKLPRRVGLVVHANQQQFRLTLSAESFAVSGAVLPDVAEADSPRMVFEERISMLRDLAAALDNMFDAFLRVRCSSAWEGQTNALRRWIVQSAKTVAAVA
jgi:hypothetical protein